jgi:predicted metal-dependent hydrolase
MLSMAGRHQLAPHFQGNALLSFRKNQESLLYWDFMSDTYDFLLVRSARKTLVMEVKEDGALIVRSPRHTDIERIRRFVSTNGEWIERKRSRALAKPPPRPKLFVEGEEFLFLGRSYSLHLDYDAPHLEIVNNRLILPRRWLGIAEVKLVEWYKHRAREYLDERCLHFAVVVGVTVNKWRLTSPERRWGSCGANGTLNFNWRLVMTPPEVLDYVVLHELMHLKYFNHSPEFWAAIREQCPDFKQHKSWLKANKYRLSI